MDNLILLGVILFIVFCTWLAWPGWKPLPQQPTWIFLLKWSGFFFTVGCAGLLLFLFTATIAAPDHTQPYAP